MDENKVATGTEFTNGLHVFMLYSIFLCKNLHILNIILNFVRFFGANDCLFLCAILKIEHFCKRKKYI